MSTEQEPYCKENPGKSSAASNDSGSREAVCGEVAIRFDGVSFSYSQDGPKALDGVDLVVPRGQLLAVVGPNGSGKSTLARHINGLLVPESGTVSVLGASTSVAGNLPRIRESVGMVMQDPDSQIVATLAADDVAFGSENLGLPREEIAKRVRESLEAVGMLEFAEASADRLSGGQKQRISIAAALAMHPEVMVLDEPTAMLDPEGRAEVMSIVDRLSESGATIVFVTHSAEEAMRADRVIALSGGCIVADGTPASVLGNEKAMAEISLTQPFCLRMASKLRRLGVRLDGDPKSSGELAEMLSRAHLETTPESAGPADSLETLEEERFSERPTTLQTHRTDAAGCIRFEDVSMCYDADGRKVCALDGISVEFPRSSFTCVIGRTGSGKSTLLQCVNGLVMPQSGSVSVDGTGIQTSEDRAAIRRSVGMSFQFPENQLFESTVEADIAFGPRNAGMEEAEIADRVRWAMTSVGLDPDELSLRSPFELSVGQQRRVAIAGSIATMPSYLVLDEPTSGLDPAGAHSLMALLARLHKEGMGIVMVTHDMDAVARWATDVVVLDGGRIVMQGDPEEVFSRPDEVAAAGLSLPSGVELARRCRCFGFSADLSSCLDEDSLAVELARWIGGH